MVAGWQADRLSYVSNVSDSRKQAFWVPRDGSAAEQQLKTMPVQTASGRFGGDVVEGRPACGEDTSVSA